MRQLVSPNGHVVVRNRLGLAEVTPDSPGAISLDVAGGAYLTIPAAAWNDLVNLIKNAPLAHLIVRE